MELPLLARIATLVKRRARNNRRQVKRVAPSRPTICLIRQDGLAEAAQATIQNLSHKGAGLLADRELSPGTVVNLLLVNAGHTFALAVDLKVVRSFRAGDGHYFVGGPFTRSLRHEELAPLMV
jgi:hypothetical protein